MYLVCLFRYARRRSNEASENQEAMRIDRSESMYKLEHLPDLSQIETLETEFDRPSKRYDGQHKKPKGDERRKMIAEHKAKKSEWIMSLHQESGRSPAFKVKPYRNDKHQLSVDRIKELKNQSKKMYARLPKGDKDEVTQQIKDDSGKLLKKYPSYATQNKYNNDENKYRHGFVNEGAKLRRGRGSRNKSFGR